MTRGKAMPTNLRSRVAPFVVALCILSSCHPVILSSCHAFDNVIDSPMYQHPDLPAPPVVMVFPEEARGLWLKALQRPEADMRCKAAGAIALARQRGVKGLETTVAPLLAELDRPEQHPTVRLTVAQALVALEAREAAPGLLRAAEAGGDDVRAIIEPALAAWDYRPARAVWLARLAEPAAPPPSLVLAIRGLAEVREEKAADRLREMALSDRGATSVRLEAARALGLLRDAGLEEDAERLAADTSKAGVSSRLAAAALLERHRGDRAVRLLQRLADDPEPAVAARAVTRLLGIDSKLVVARVERLLASPAARLRSLGAEVLFREPTADHVRLLGDRLDDLHAGVRVQARRFLSELAARPDWRRPVIEQGSRLLAASGWRGQEQATILLAQLDHKPAAARLVELLRVEGPPEVYLTAAWGLRRLAVADTLPAVLRHVEAQQRRLRALAGRIDSEPMLLDHQLSQLNQLLGQQKYRPADAVLRQFIPRMAKPMAVDVGFESRAAAVWALGLIHEGKAVPDLAGAVEGRLNDINTIPPEDARVRRMCAVTLGRLGAKAAVPSLRKHFGDHEPSRDPVNNACGWALARLTGEPVPPAKPIRMVQRDWFLTPHE
jgi:HEAT repeat protein